jgi:geranylgeranyl reductase family protein
MSSELRGSSEVLVVGAGPAGCAAGITLARAGIDVCVIDRASFPRDKVCGDAISNDGVEIIRGLGAGDLLEGAPHTLVDRAAAIFPDGHRITRGYDRPGYIVPRYHLDDCLRRALEASGARLVQRRQIAALVSSPEGRVTGATGTHLDWQARLTIAADGYGSVGLSTLAVPKPEGRHLAISATGYFENVDFPYGASTSDHYFDAQLPYGYGWIFPAVNGVSNIGVYLRSDAYRHQDAPLKQLYTDFIERHVTRFRHARPVSRMRVWSLPLAPRSIPLTAPGLALVGDAAGLVDPLSGEGIWQALHSGVLAGSAFITPLREQRDPTTEELEEYEASCKRDIHLPSRAKLAVQRGIATIVDRKLYRVPLVRSALRWGYQKGALEMTKS